MADGLGPWVSFWRLLSQKRKVLTSSGSQIWFQEMNVSHLKPKPPATTAHRKGREEGSGQTYQGDESDSEPGLGEAFGCSELLPSSSFFPSLYLWCGGSCRVPACFQTRAHLWGVRLCCPVLCPSRQLFWNSFAWVFILSLYSQSFHIPVY